MTSSPLLPQAFWFRWSVPCHRVDGIPNSRGRLLDLPESCGLPPVETLNDVEPWASVRVAWNPSGLALAVEVTGKTGPIVFDPVMPEASDGAQLWIDTRDTRDIHRASRFCHRFHAALEPEGKGKALRVHARPLKIHRASADAPLCRPDLIRTQAERSRQGWRLELFLPAEALHGFDPDTNRRLGFMYRVTDPNRGEQTFGLGREFPLGEDPSLWATLELEG